VPLNCPTRCAPQPAPQGGYQACFPDMLIGGPHPGFGEALASRFGGEGGAAAVMESSLHATRNFG
jgi:hypothetical protein